MFEDDERHPRDHESDPAHNDQVGYDWADEGGATAEGPATHEESGHPHGDTAEEPAAE